jgi:hypothetical protein
MRCSVLDPYRSMSFQLITSGYIILQIKSAFLISVYPESEFFPSRIQGQKDPDPGSASKNLSIFNAKNCFQALGNMIQDVHPGSGSKSLFFLYIPNPEVIKAPDPGS